MKNRLLSRVQRHASMAVLFRDADLEQVPQPFGLPVVQAVWPVGEETAESAIPFEQTPAETAEPIATTPPSVVSPGPPAVFRQATANVTTPTPPARPIATKPAIPSVTVNRPPVTVNRPPVAVSPTAVSPVSPVMRQLAPTPTSTPPTQPPAGAESGENDTSWRRLRNIFDRHQEQATLEESQQVTANEGPSDVQTMRVPEPPPAPAAPARPLPVAPPPSRPAPPGFYAAKGQQGMSGETAVFSPAAPASKAPTSVQTKSVVAAAHTATAGQREIAQPSPVTETQEEMGGIEPPVMETSPEKPGIVQPVVMAAHPDTSIQRKIESPQPSPVAKGSPRMAEESVEPSLMETGRADAQTQEKVESTQPTVLPAVVAAHTDTGVQREVEGVHSSPVVEVPHRGTGGQRGEVSRQFQPSTTAVTPLTEAGMTSPEPVTTLPLEAVWPVQRQAAPTPTPQPAMVQPAPAGPVAELPAEEADVVRHTLSRVSAGQPTDSTVELVLPRRPRPTPTGSPGKSVQRQPAEPAVKAEPATPAMIQTDIGPLPADLWQILGQEPPAQPGVDGNTAVMRAIETAEFPPIVQQVVTPPPVAHQGKPPAPPQFRTTTETPPTLPDEPAVPVTTRQPESVSAGAVMPETIPFRPGKPEEKTTPSIMRQADTQTSPPHANQPHQDKPETDEDITGRWEIPPNTWAAPPDIQREESASAPPPAPTPANEENGETKTAEVDIDDVARRVYKDLKRRLVIEWERVRGRF